MNLKIRSKITLAKHLTSLLMSFSLLSACTYNPFTPNNHTTGSPAGAAVGGAAGAGSMALLGAPKSVIAIGGIGGAMLGYYVTTLRYDSGGVMHSGGQVYKIGDKVGIDIPTDSLFESNSAEFLPGSTAILDSAATVLLRYPNNNILISGNTSGFGRAKWERALSEKRAKQVAAYLWNAGINPFKGTGLDMRKLNYVGYGDYLPISNHYTNDGIRQNSHIQITSYPSASDLGLDKKGIGMRNIGSLDDDNTNAPDTMSCGDNSETQDACAKMFT